MNRHLQILCLLALLIKGTLTFAFNESLRFEAKGLDCAGRQIKDGLQVLDFRYAPIMEQACIGLPDDPYKSIVGCEKARSNPGLYYDYNRVGPFMGFQTRVLASVKGDGSLGPLKQKLHSARIPIVNIEQDKGNLKLVQQFWASAPRSSDMNQTSNPRADYLWLKLRNESDSPTEGSILLSIDSPKQLMLNESKTQLVEKDSNRVYCVFDRACESSEYRQGGLVNVITLPSVNQDWARPNTACTEQFKHIMSNKNEPLSFSYPVSNGKAYKVVFGLIEGFHQKPFIRPLDIRIEDQVVKKVDLVQEYGTNVPVILSFDAEDKNSDGRIDFGVYPVGGAKDTTSVLSCLWIFDGDSRVAENEILSGQADSKALAVINAQNVALSKTNSVRLAFKGAKLDPGQQSSLLVKFLLGADAAVEIQADEAAREQQRAIEYWQNVDLPYNRIEVPDKNMQALLDSCVRNIYQAREIKDGLPAFQVGPTRYRGLWVVDGAFIMEAVSYLGRTEEARRGIQYLLSFQREDGAFMLIDGHWKEVGIVLWAVSRHAHLSGDKEWLESIWPKIEKGVVFIETMRRMPDDDAPNAGLVPDGYSDGGLGGKYPEYTNVYWTLAGYKSAIEAANWLGKLKQAQKWQAQYDDFYNTFSKAAQRDMKTDKYGNRFLPIRMVDDQNVPGQKAQWAFLHAVFPGSVFSPNDPLVTGNMAMLKANEAQGLIRNTGWVKDGLWGYFGSFYGHAWLWLDDGQKAADTLYNFANHASPLLVWREEQRPVGEPEDYCGDMPHNWASAELIRLIRHLLVLERGRELHLLQGLPSAWTKPGSKTRLTQMPTSFGPIDLCLQIADNGKSAELTINPPARERPDTIVCHFEHFRLPVKSIEYENEEFKGQFIEIPSDQSSTMKIFFDE